MTEDSNAISQIQIENSEDEYIDTNYLFPKSINNIPLCYLGFCIRSN